MASLLGRCMFFIIFLKDNLIVNLPHRSLRFVPWPKRFKQWMTASPRVAIRQGLPPLLLLKIRRLSRPDMRSTVKRSRNTLIVRINRPDFQRVLSDISKAGLERLCRIRTLSWLFPILQHRNTYFDARGRYIFKSWSCCIGYRTRGGSSSSTR